MENKKKKLVAGLILLMLILAVLGLGIMFLEKPKEKPGKLTLEDLLQSTSERSIRNGTIISSGETPYHTLVATPAAMFYDNDRVLNAAPLLVAYKEPSKAVTRFMEQYKDGQDNLIAVGQPGLDITPDIRIDGNNPRAISIGLANRMWARSDGVILIKADCQEAYNIAVPTVPLASYLNIPVIVTHSLDGDIKDILDKLGVKYSIVCGDLDVYGKKTLILKGDDRSFETDLVTIQDLTRGFIEHPEGFGNNISYVTMANPLDITEPKVEDSTTLKYQGELYNHATSSVGVWPGTTGVHEGEDFEIEIPGDYDIAHLHFNLRFKPHDQADLIGERIYVFVYDSDDDAQEAFFGTPGGKIEDDCRTVDFDLILFNNTGKHKIHVQGREVFEGVPIPNVNENPVRFDLTVEIEKLGSPIIPLMPDLSSLAPYLTAYHQGLVLARPEFALQYPGYTGCIDCGEPTTSEESIEDANKQALYTHNELLKLLTRLSDQSLEDVLGNSEAINSLADKYYSEPVYLGIIADTNMIPHYYYEGGDAAEGYGEPGDTLYGDINADPNDPFNDLGPGRISPDMPDLELPVGRLVGFDAQDVSALLGRTFFYYDIIDGFSGFDQSDAQAIWKNNAYLFLGSKIPVEMMYGALFDNIKESLMEGGFNVKETSEALSHRENSDRFQTGSNYILGGVHGFYYWYVPAARTKYAGGSAFDVAHVREMNFGPSTMFLVSCVTGRIDGLNPENCLAMAYLHCGMVGFVGATRSTYGGLDMETDLDMRLEPTGAVLMSKYFTQQIMDDQDIGLALRNAKNLYLPDDAASGSEAGLARIMYAHYIVHGDPAFNPYEPANNG